MMFDIESTTPTLSEYITKPFHIFVIYAARGIKYDFRYFDPGSPLVFYTPLASLFCFVFVKESTSHDDGHNQK